MAQLQSFSRLFLVAERVPLGLIGVVFTAVDLQAGRWASSPSSASWRLLGMIARMR